MAKKEPNSPKLYDPLKGTVYGNVLDRYDNTAYNLKLYMIPPIASTPNSSAGQAVPGNPRNPTSQSASSGNPYFIGNTGASTNQGGYMYSYYRAKPEETVVLAQTGVTGNQIDNLQITSAIGVGGAFNTSKISFDVIQPGAANFIDQMIATKAKIGAPVFANDVPLFLEVSFKGYYTNEQDDDTPSGVAVPAGPHVYPLIVSTINLEIDEKGSIYNFDCAVKSQKAYSDQFYRLPAALTTTGSTITDFVRNLKTHLDDYAEEHNTEYGVKDEICFDLSGILDPNNPDGCFLDTQGLTSNLDERAEDINRIMNPELLNSKPDEYEDILDGNDKDEGDLDIFIKDDKLTFREGVTIENFFATILSMSDQFFSKLTRTENPDDPEGAKVVDKSKTYVKWFKINATVEYIDYDAKRNTYATRVIYKPTIYNTANDQVQFSAKEQTGLNKKEVQDRFDGMSIFKAYHYIYTGRNDQIINCRIAYNAGHALLVAPARGVTGDFSTVHAKSQSSRAGINDDQTNQTNRDAAKQALNQETAEDAFSKLARDPNDIRAIGQTLGLSDAEIREAQADSSSQSARILKNILANQQIADALRTQQTAQNRTTQSDSFKGISGGTYTDKPSGFVYSADIIDSVSERMDQALTLQAARSKVTQLRQQYKADPGASDADVGDLTDNAAPAVQQLHVSNPAEAATYDGSPRNTIFGYLMQQHGSTDFLVKLDMEIKGDPWYLGPPSITGKGSPLAPSSEISTKSEPDFANYGKNENYVMFDMQSPRLFDFDVEREDNNTGYWTPAGTAYFISGIYRMVTVVSNFSGGQFTQELNLNKLTPMKISMLDKKPPDMNTPGTP